MHTANIFVRLSIIAPTIIILIGCGSKGVPTFPTNDTPTFAQTSVDTGTSKRFLWGVWDCRYDPSNGNLDTALVRGASFHVNVASWINPPNLTVKVKSFDPIAAIIDIDVTIINPYGGTDLRGFDVHGVIMGNGGTLASKADPNVMFMSPLGLRLENADGYTRWWNGVEFKTPGLCGYSPGFFGSKIFTPTTTINPYKYFADALTKDEPVVPSIDIANRGTFSTATKHTRNYLIRFPIIDGTPNYTFQYAIDASWAEPAAGNPSPKPIEDFPIEANCPEAYHIKADASQSTVYYVNGSQLGGDLKLSLEIFDWTAPSNPAGIAGEIKSIQIESPTLFDGVINVPLTASAGSLTTSGIFNITVPNTHPSADSNQEVLVTVKSSSPDNYQPSVNGPVYPQDASLAAYALIEVPVHDPDYCWTRTWGNTNNDWAYEVATDDSGNIYVCGNFESPTIDLDPSSGIDLHTSNGSFDAYFSKFDSDGNFLWAKSWGGPGYDLANSISVDKDGYIYLAGYFSDTVDFDPVSDTVDNHSSNGEADAFVEKYDPSGHYLWARTWGGSWYDSSRDVAVDVYGNVTVSGDFWYTSDFDPSGGVDEHTSVGDGDVFLTNFDSSGNFIWAKTWGGTGADIGEALGTDGVGSIFVTGMFLNSADFDPGTGVDTHVADSHWGAFFSKFNLSGKFQWARSWDGPGIDAGYAIAVDHWGTSYITGVFSDDVDFDPGLGEDWHHANGYSDVFVSKYDADGIFQWARSWGAVKSDFGTGIAIDVLDNVYVQSVFEQTVDFDPGAGVENRTSAGNEDASVSMFDSSGTFKWVKTWGGASEDWTEDIALDQNSDILISGFFCQTVDFDPGVGVDYHTSNGISNSCLSKFCEN
jgi:hypothetical protein